MKITKCKNRNLYRTYVRKPDGSYKQIYGKTKKEVREKAETLAFDIKSGKFVEDNKISVKDWLKEWEDKYLININESSVITYKSIVETKLIPYLGSIKLQDLTHNNVQNMIYDLNKTYSYKTVKNVHLVLHRALRDAIFNGYIPVNPAENIILPKEEKKQSKYMDRQEAKEFIRLCYELVPDYADCFEFIIFTGLRIGEFVGLSMNSYDRENKMIIVNQQYQEKLKKYVPPKGGIIREVALSNRAYEIIENRIKNNNVYENVIPKFNPDNLIFLSPNLSRISQKTLRKKIKIVAREMKKPDLTVHDLRHTFAVITLESGTDIKTLQERLGHADATFTMNKYAHSTKTMNILAARNLDNYF